MFTIGVFQDARWAERGLQALLADGFGSETLTVLAKSSPDVAALVERHLGVPARELELKGLGAVTAAGTLVRALNDGGTLQTVGLAGSIGRAGFQVHDARIFETLVGRGGVLVAIESEPRAADALAKLHSFGGGNAAIGAWLGRF